MLRSLQTTFMLMALVSMACATIITSANPDDLLAYQKQCHANMTDWAPTSGGPPRNYGILLFRAFEHLDVMGPLDVLSSLGLRTTIKLSLIAESLDPVTSAPQMPLATNSTAWATILPTHTFDTAPDDLEVLIVPGGAGTRAPASQFEKTWEFLEMRYPKLRYLITVCTGSLLVSRRTTILNGRNATTNKLAFAQVAANNTAVNWFPAARWVVDGNVWTGSGVTAGIDTAFAFVSCMFGEETAAGVARFIEYVRNVDPRRDPFAVS